ncbi:MAG: thiamine pyrophosphate-requiring protein [Hyphomicrobiales bacterium]|nr:thiamine pyrophosphate-requiring protein [Hyphomicrobiales bacterium]
MNRPISQPVSAAEMLLAAMRAGGVDYLFANAGTDFPPIIEGLARAPETGLDMPTALVIPHETVAVAMAHGFYLVTGRPQAVMVHVNVGLANSLMGLINAASDNIPLLLCSGRTPATELGRFGGRNRPIHWGQEMRDQGAIVRECVKWDYELRYPEQAAALIARALAVAQSAPSGPVYLSLPREVLADTVPADAAPPAPLSPTRPGPPPADAVARAADLIAAAKRPLIVVQRPVSFADFGPLPDFAARFALPVIDFWAVRNALASDHPMHLGYDTALFIAEADLVITVEALVPWVPAVGEPAKGFKVIALGTDPLFSRVPVRGFAVDVNLAGDPAAAISALASALDARKTARSKAVAKRRDWIAARRAERDEACARRVKAGRTQPMSPAWVSHCLSEAKDDDAAIFSELGCDVSVMRFTRPQTLFRNPLSGGLGMALPAALGAKLADRARTVIACVGDGSYMFANPVACHQTAAMHDLPILTVVFNNAVWQAVRRATKSMYPEGRAVAANTIPITSLGVPPDYAAIARAHGAFAETVEEADALPGAIARALAATREEGRQALLDVKVSY